jgi:hypothetical protein
MAMLNKAGANNKYLMRTESYQLFSQLLEGYLNEASTSINLILDNPGGKQVVKHLHTDMGLAHDQDYRQVEKISWSELKDTRRGAWVIIKGTTGTGAIRATASGTYEATASAGGDVENATDSRGGNIIDFLKSKIGKLQKFYVGNNTSSVRDKQKKRADQQAGTDTSIVSVDTLTKKFKPLWVKAITAAIADVKGHIANQIKNDAFDKAAKKLEHVKRLQSAIESLETDSDTPGSVKAAINLAVLMAASHHYPEQTGAISRGGYNSGYNAQRSEGGSQLLKDIAGGDQKKLSTVLTFFKRSLISG